MNTARRYAAFTLVELLVVIGIIALLISILLPGLNKARQQANSLKCAANEKAIGQLIMIYAADNRGIFPRSGQTIGMGWQDPGTNPNDGSNPQNNTRADNGRVQFWPDTLTLLTNKRSVPQAAGATTGTGTGDYAGYNLANADSLAADFSQIFHDTDTPVTGWKPRVSSYFVNMRVIAPQNAKDRAFAPGGGSSPNIHFIPQFRQGKLRGSGATMMTWCAPVRVGADGTADILQYDSASWSLDGFGYSDGGHFYVNARRSWSPSQSLAYLGQKIGIASSGGTSYGAPVTKSGLIATNVDYDTVTGNAMRFRHLGNKAINALFVDGHVESRPLGEVYARDICIGQ